MSRTKKAEGPHKDAADEHGGKTSHAKAMEARQAPGYTALSVEEVAKHRLELNREVPPGGHYDPAEIRRHDTSGKDRLFEHRVQHDDADMESDKTRHARDAERHGHSPVPGRRWS